MLKDIRIEISSDLDYEGMVVDILFKNNLLAKLECDQGFENTKIHFFEKKNENAVWELDYFSFVEILNKSLIELKEANQID